MKMRIIFFTFIPFMVSGCADFTSIWRIGEVDGVQVASLDAKQRLFIANAQKYCAEPSPDALSAFSSSFGLGVSIPEKAAASLAQGLSEGAGSIGLRTQSIQLLRDMLYRVCEAAHNDFLNEQIVAQLHERYQDTMVAILAIEQLTGAVQAKQVVLGGSSNAAAAAGTLIGVTKRLEEAEAYEAKKKKEQEEAQEKVNTLEGSANVEGSVAQAQTEHDAAVAQWSTQDQKVKNIEATCSTNPADPSCPTLETERKALEPLEQTKLEKEKTLNERTEALKEAKAELQRANEHYETAQKNRDLIGQMQGQASSEASAATTATGEFEKTVTFKPIAKDVAQEVKDAVVKIVDKVIDKDHKADTCLVLLSSSDRQQMLAAKKVEKETLESQQATDKAAFMADANSVKNLQEAQNTITKAQELDLFCQNVIRDSLQHPLPTVTPPANIVVPALNPVHGTPATHAAIQAFLSGAVAESKVGDTVLEVLEVTNDAPVNFKIGPNTVTFSAVDSAGHRGTAQAIVTVDNQPPVVSPPSNITVTAVDNFGTPASHLDIQRFLNGATAKDNVDQSPTAQVEGSFPDPFPLGTTTVTFSATDASGNKTPHTVQATLTVEDQTPPRVTPPSDLVIDTAGGSPPAIANSQIQDFLHGARAEDNVAGRLLPSDDSGAILSDPVTIGSYIITFSAQDHKGNIGFAKATIRVK